MSTIAAAAAAEVKIPLVSATATRTQAYAPQLTYPPMRMIDGRFELQNGWAGFPQDGVPAKEETAVFQTSQPVSAPGLMIKIHQLQGAMQMLNRFRISVSSSPRNAYRGGRPPGAAARAQWKVLTPANVTLPNPLKYEVLSDNSVRIINTALEGVYTVVFNEPMQGITGIRLEVLKSPTGAQYVGMNNTGSWVIQEFEAFSMATGAAPSLAEVLSAK